MKDRVLTRFPRQPMLLPAALLAALATAGSAAPVPDKEIPGKEILVEADAALQFGEADKALSLLASLPQNGAEIAEAENLHCRVEFTLAHWDEAIKHCEQAVRLDGQSSQNHMWLGRALGEKASEAVFLTAYSLGKRVLVEFEQAAKLDPRNAPALSNLGEFYVEAPSMMGGGLGKAESVAGELDPVDPARADELRSRIASEHNDTASAEHDLKQAVAVSSHPAYEWATLARFYRDRKRWDEMDTAISSCERAVDRDPHSGVALYDAAGVLIVEKREPELAARLLEKYLNGPGKSEEAPAFVAYTRLALLKQKLGDQAGATEAQTAALALAHDYTAAKDLRR